MQLAREALPSMSGRHRSIRLGRLATKAEHSAGAGGYGRAGPFIGRA